MSTPAPAGASPPPATASPPPATATSPPGTAAAVPAITPSTANITEGATDPNNPPPTDGSQGAEGQATTTESEQEPKRDINAELFYTYKKLRKEFGRQERCIMDHFRIHANVKPLKKYRNMVLRKTRIERGIQAAPDMNLTEMNTIRAEYVDFQGAHIEGGWPKDINVQEPDMVQRHRKKLEKDDNFNNVVPILADEMEEHIKNNNTINFYRHNFTCEPVIGPSKDFIATATTVNMFKNPYAKPRRVSRIQFSPENNGRMAVAMCPYEFDPTLRDVKDHVGEAFFWDVENPAVPESTVRAGSFFTDVRFHPKTAANNLIGGLFSGQVAVWDVRVGAYPQQVTPYDAGHQDVCTTALWINSRSGTEFFSSGINGQVIWWDERNLQEPLDMLWCDPEKGIMRPDAAEGCVCLEYEPSIPTKFLAGTDRGNVMVFMKKKKNPAERMIQLYKAHHGPVVACSRNPVYIKNFLTAGDYHLRIFSEDCKESSIMWTIPADARYSDAKWLHHRPSAFAACRSDGVVEWYDMLIKGVGRNVLEMQVCDEALSTICPADSPKHIAVGSVLGDVRLIEMSDSLAEFTKEEKVPLGSVFDLESRREKYLEQRRREIRLKKRDEERQEALRKKIEAEEIAAAAAGGAGPSQSGAVDAPGPSEAPSEAQTEAPAPPPEGDK